MRHHKSSKTRSARGATTAMVVACAFVLVIVIVAIVQLCMFLSGSQKVRNEVEASVLNIAMRAPDLKSGNGGQYYTDCHDINGEIGLTNINRVWGKALLIAANAAEMTRSGQSGMGPASADSAYSGAEGLTKDLKEKATSDSGLSSFSQLPGASPASSSTAPSTASTSGGGMAGPPVEQGYVHRGEESNIAFDHTQFPTGLDINLNPVEKGNSKFLGGYKTVQINGKTFMFVPFRQGEIPHLISAEEFQFNREPPSGAIAAIPANAFRSAGKVGDGIAAASAVANPQKSYKLAIPFAYVTIKLEKNQANWKVNGSKIKSSTYEFMPEQQWEIKSHDVGCGMLNGYASLGNEYTRPSLYDVINALPGNHAAAFEKMLQRTREIDSDMTLEKLNALLMQTNVQPNVYEYVIYPTYKTRDHVEPEMKVAARTEVTEPWFRWAPPEGTESLIVREIAKQDEPNHNWGQVIGSWRLQEHHVDETGQLMWTPGTGLYQCLGMLRIQRTADITFRGRCP